MADLVDTAMSSPPAVPRSLEDPEATRRMSVYAQDEATRSWDSKDGARGEPRTPSITDTQAQSRVDELLGPPSSAVQKLLATQGEADSEASGGGIKGALGRLGAKLAGAIKSEPQEAPPPPAPSEARGDFVQLRVGAGEGARAYEALLPGRLHDLHHDRDHLSFVAEPGLFSVALALLLQAKVEIYGLERTPNR